MAYIFHIIEKNEWEKVQASAQDYRPVTLEKEGFIHCSKTDQILDVANHMFKGREHGHLLLLKIDEEKVTPEIKHEPPFEFPMAEIYYPHIYGPLNLDAVVDVFDFSTGSGGDYILPKVL